MLRSNSLVILTICYLIVLAQADDGEYDYHYEGVKQTVNENGFLNFSMDVKKIGDSTFTVEGEMAHKETTEGMEIEMVSYHSDEKDGEMTETKFKGRKNICDFMKGFYKSHIYPKFKDTSNIPTPETCPLPAENYVIKSTEVDCKKFNHFLKPGHWKMIFKVCEGDKVFSEVEVSGMIQKKE